MDKELTAGGSSGGEAAALAAGVQIYAERWREDLCLGAPEVIEAAMPRITPTDPAWT